MGFILVLHDLLEPIYLKLCILYQTMRDSKEKRHFIEANVAYAAAYYDIVRSLAENLRLALPIWFSISLNVLPAPFRLLFAQRRR
jgi:hypothetical protein